MGIYTIRQETKDAWKRDVDLLRAYMEGQEINPENTETFHRGLEKIYLRMMKDVIDEVMLPRGEFLYKYRKGWSDRRAAKLINAEMRRMLAGPRQFTLLAPPATLQ